MSKSKCKLSLQSEPENTSAYFTCAGCSKDFNSDSNDTIWKLYFGRSGDHLKFCRNCIATLGDLIRLR